MSKEFWSSLIPGPIVLEIEIFWINWPLTAAGFALLIVLTIKLKFSANLLASNEYGAFATPKIMNVCKWFSDGQDYFNDLHGNSLDYFYLVEEIEKTFNITAGQNLSLCRTPIDFARKIKEISTLWSGNMVF